MVMILKISTFFDFDESVFINLSKDGDEVRFLSSSHPFLSVRREKTFGRE